MENQLIEFIKKIISHFTDKVHHSYTISSDLIELDLHCADIWEEFQLRALHSICKIESQKFENILDWANFDKSFLISSIPSQKKVRIKWFKNEL